MKQSKRILTAFMVAILTVGLLVGSGLSASAKELHTISREWNHCLLRYWNDKSATQIGQNSDGYLELDISASGNLEVGLGIMSFPLHSGMSVESYYGIVPERMKFKTCFYVEEYSGSVPPFSDIPGIELIVDDSNGEVGSAFIPRSAITYSVFDDGFRQVDISFDINLLDYFDEDLFDGADLSDFTFLFYFSSCNNIFYDNSTYRTSVVIRPLGSFMEFTYSMPTIDDEINSNLDDVNSNLNNIQDSLQNNANADNFKSDWSAYFADNPVDSWGTLPQFNISPIVLLITNSVDEMAFLWSPFIANSYIIEINGVSFDPVRLYIDLLLYTSMIIMMFQLIRGVRK